MSNESAKLSHLLTDTRDNDDPGIPPEVMCKIFAKALHNLAAKLDADATVTDTNYAALADATSYP